MSTLAMVPRAIPQALPAVYRAAMHDEAGQLFARAAAGDQVSLEQLLERYLPQLHAYVHARLGNGLGAREGSVDVVQSVCRQVLGARASFEFRGEERFRAWLFTTALNKLREKHRLHTNQRRSVKREEKALDHEPVTAAAFFITPSQHAMGKETADAIAAGLAALSEEHREVITLARIAALPHRVIAEVMERSEEATRKLLGRAILALAEQLEQRGVDLDQWNRT